MKNEEAKFILNGYRPNGADGQDAMFCAALRQAQSDPELGAWLARSRAYDTAVAAKLGEIAPPAGLRAAILAGARVSEQPRTAWWKPAGLAVAAAVAVLVTAVTLWPQPAVTDSALVRLAMRDAKEEARHGGRGEETKTFQAELGAAGNRLAQAQAVDFKALAKSGCRVLEVNGRSVLEVCFTRNGTWFHCYIARCEDFPALARKQGAVFAANDGITAVSWADGTHRFVVAGRGGREDLARLL